MKNTFNALTILLSAVLLLGGRSISAQNKESYLKVGDKIFDHTFSELQNYSKKTATISDFRGKWLILDLWGRSCGGCLASFPKMNELSKEFNNRVQLIMVGVVAGKDREQLNINEQLTKAVYYRLAKRHNLSFTVAFDSILEKKVNPRGFPHLLIIDPQGFVRAKTSFITFGQLNALLQGRKTDLQPAYSRNEPWRNYNDSLPLLTNGIKANGGIDTSYLYRSIISDWIPGTTTEHVINLKTGQNVNIDEGRLEVPVGWITTLYHLAYYGTNEWNTYDDYSYEHVYWHLSFEGADSSNIELDKLYAYSLTIPKKQSNPEYMMKLVWKPIFRFFARCSGVFNV